MRLAERALSEVTDNALSRSGRTQPAGRDWMAAPPPAECSEAPSLRSFAIALGLVPASALEDEEGNRPPMPIPVGAMIKALTRQADRAVPDDEDESAGETLAGFYSFLSDYTQPKQSAGHLSSTIDQTTWMMDWTFDHASDKSTAFHVLGTTYLAITSRERPLTLSGRG